MQIIVDTEKVPRTLTEMDVAAGMLIQFVHGSVHIVRMEGFIRLHNSMIPPMLSIAAIGARPEPNNNNYAIFWVY